MKAAGPNDHEFSYLADSRQRIGMQFSGRGQYDPDSLFRRLTHGVFQEEKSYGQHAQSQFFANIPSEINTHAGIFNNDIDLLIISYPSVINVPLFYELHIPRQII